MTSYAVSDAFSLQMKNVYEREIIAVLSYCENCEMTHLQREQTVVIQTNRSRLIDPD